MTDATHIFSPAGLRAKAPNISRLMNMSLEREGLLSLAVGFTDNASLPMKEVAGMVAELASRPAAIETLQYGATQGRLGLRKLLAERLRTQEPDLPEVGELAANCLITNGSQQALYLAMQVLCEPGDIVLVDRPSYFVFLEMLAGMGVKAVSLPTSDVGVLDSGGLERLLGQLEETGNRRRVKAVYFVSYFSNPSSRCLSESEKTLVADALRKRGMMVPVVEDAAYRDLYFDNPYPARSVLSLAAWEGFPRLYLGTMTKTFATGLKIGYGFCSHQGLLSRMLNIKGCQDFGSSNFAQALCEEALRTGAFDAQLLRLRALYKRKMQVLNEALETEGLRSLGWSWRPAAGGLYLWVKAPAAVETRMDSPFCMACLEEGVVYVPGDLCHGDAAPSNTLRLSFGVLDEAGLREAARRFVKAARRG